MIHSSKMSNQWTTREPPVVCLKSIEAEYKRKNSKSQKKKSGELGELKHDRQQSSSGKRSRIKIGVLGMLKKKISACRADYDLG